MKSRENTVHESMSAALSSDDTCCFIVNFVLLRTESTNSYPTENTQYRFGFDVDI